uniref:Uncharacterized protein n=1 Tax=Arundo donax TaxID=35708 RepID=A0A0A9D2C7_ARUDO
MYSTVSNVCLLLLPNPLGERNASIHCRQLQINKVSSIPPRHMPTDLKMTSALSLAS